MQGSSPKELVKHAEELCLALTDEVVLTSGIFDLKSRALHACGSLVNGNFYSSDIYIFYTSGVIVLLL
jgi:hypothetical protein